MEEVREEKGSTRFNLRKHFRWQYAPPSFVATQERTYGAPEAPTLGPGRTELIYENGRLAEIHLKGHEGLQFSYQGECENVRVTAERTFAPDVLGSLKAAPCFTSPMHYSSTCVGGW